MKKLILFPVLLACLSFLYGQDTVFLETCGSMDVSSAKKVDTYTGWDNTAPVDFTRTLTLDGYADVRSTSTTTNHVWFPSGKCADLIISNIPTAAYRNLRLSFEIAAYKLTDANVNKLTVYCNDSVLTIPDITFPSSKFIQVPGIAISNSQHISLKFEYTSGNNANGYRLDNFKITGEKVISDVLNPKVEDFRVQISGNKLTISNTADGTIVEVYNLLGTLIQTTVLHESSIKLAGTLPAGFYLVRAGKNICKTIF